MLRTSIAIATAKLATWTARAVRLGAATTLPGTLARRIEPQILPQLARKLRYGSVLVTGTNGKTTTSSLLNLIFERSGWHVLHNRGGANLIAGLTSIFVQRSSLQGDLVADIAVLETDEATVPRASSELAPQGIVVTNFFRDQLDRYGELDKTVSLVRRGIQALPSGRTVYLNADDPLVVSLQERQDLNYVFFGLEEPALALKEMKQSAEARVCPRCGVTLQYNHFYFAHHGDYRCSSCGFHRPQPTITISDVCLRGLHGSEFTVRHPGGEFAAKIRLPGVYNLYNILAATSVALSQKLFPEVIVTALGDLPPAFGRMESLEIQERSVYLALVKNPTGFNEVIRTFVSDGHRLNLLFVLNDNIADGTDISWLWDVDFELLADHLTQIASITISGLRASEMAVRLKYAGLNVCEDDIFPEPDAAFERALSLAPSGEVLQVMPTYTAMLSLRDYLVRQGYLNQYWKE